MSANGEYWRTGPRGPLDPKNAELVRIRYKGGGEISQTPLVASIAIARGQATRIIPDKVTSQRK